MRIAVLGAGAVGGTIAALLDRAGHDVEVTARGEHLAAITRAGLRLEGAWGEHTAWLRAGERLDLAPSLAILATKAHDAEDALRANADVLRGAPLLVVQNGLDGVEAAGRVLRPSDCAGGLALFAASHLEPGLVTVTSPGDTYIGSPGSRANDAALLAAEVLGAVLPTVVARDLLGAQWTKLLVNQVNAMPAITGLSVQETIAHPDLRRIIARSLREAARVGIAAGIRFEPVQGLDDALLRRVARSPLILVERVPLAFAQRMGDVPNPGSTLQSIRRGRPTEIEHLNGAIVRAAGRVGADARVNTLLVELVHEVERTGVFLSPAEVVARARA